MKITEEQEQPPLLRTSLLTTVILTIIFTVLFLFLSKYYINSLFDDVEKNYRQNLVNIISLAHNAIEPLLAKVRKDEITADEAISKIRPLIRSMTYNDRDGKNYIFMTTYDGISLVQPFDLGKEMTDRSGLIDIKGVYIVKELLRAVKEHPEGSFVRYHYPHFSRHNDIQEKLTYVIGLPEIKCYLATGMYMKSTIDNQKRILLNIRYISILLIIIVLIPVTVSIFAVIKWNSQLQSEIWIRSKAEEELKQSEEKYRSIFENSIEGIYQTTPDGFFISANPALARIFGYDSPQEMTGTHVNIIDHYVDPDDRKKFILMLNKRGFVEDFIVRMKRRSGSFIWVSINSRLVRDNEGNILYYEGRLEDITKRKIAEEMLVMSEEKFSKIFMASPDGIIISRMEDGLLIDANESAEKITGWEKSDVRGTTIAHDTFWVNTADRKYMVSEINAGRDVINREFIFRRNDGSERYGIFSARKLNIAGESCLIIILRDITDRIRLEQEHKKMEQQLIQSQKMDAIGQLAGGMAHDFNNILMIIQGNISLIMLKHSPGDPLYDRLKTVEENIQRGVNLTRQLLGFAREGKYETRTLSVNELIRKSAGFFLETKKEIEAEIQLDKDIPSIEADAGQMEQVFINIFINASHAMPEGGQLFIKTSDIILNKSEAESFDVKPGRYVRITITDTGTGMNEQTLKRIFEPFFTTKADQGGTGLGLASAYGIIRNHGGIINAYSEPGKGTTFTIYLPSSKRPASRDEIKQPGEKLLTGSGTILLIDDEQTIMNIVTEMLKTLGYDVFYASSEHEALEIYSKNHESIKLVILDMILRGTGGAQLFKKLKEINPGVKVILSSGYSLRGEVQKVMEMGCAGFIQKPYNFSEISGIIHRVLSSG